MKIKNIKINNYGNLKQKEINLENNINIIYGKNETGKSTLLNYLKNIFYILSHFFYILLCWKIFYNIIIICFSKTPIFSRSFICLFIES